MTIINDAEYLLYYNRCSVLLEITEAIAREMEKQNITLFQLARKLHKRQPHITHDKTYKDLRKIMSGCNGITIEQIADIFLALDCEFSVKLYSHDFK